MKVGGPADLWAEAKTKSELVEVLRLAHKLKIKYFVLAGGSNVIFPDKGFRGLVVRYVANKVEILNRVQDDVGKVRGGGSEISGICPKSVKSVVVEAGAMLGDVVRHLLKQNLGGFDFLANIPGSVGGAVIGNAGCYGKEIKDVLREVEIFNVKTGKTSKVKPGELGFNYRQSKLKDHSELIVLSATFKLEKVDKKQALQEIAAEKQLRKDKHPLGPSCGSWFKNPSRTEPAWKFIEAAGMKGATIGGARISHKHSNFLINCGGAKSVDIIKLSKLVQRKVKAQTGIFLREEVGIIV